MQQSAVTKNDKLDVFYIPLKFCFALLFKCLLFHHDLFPLVKSRRVNFSYGRKLSYWKHSGKREKRHEIVKGVVC